MGHTQAIFSNANPSPHGEVFRWITVKNNFIGFHAYTNAPDQVAFLKHRHRHRFYVESLIQVFHDDRELEFFIVQSHIEAEIIPFLPHHNLGSCEQIAEQIMWGLINSYGDHRNYYVEVSEDDENSATSSWSPYNQPHWATGIRQDAPGQTAGKPPTETVHRSERNSISTYRG